MRVFYGTSVRLRDIGPKLNQPISHLAESLFRSLEHKLHFCMFPWRFSLHHKTHMNPFLLSFSYQQMFYQPCDWMWKGIAHWRMSFLEINFKAIVCILPIPFSLWQTQHPVKVTKSSWHEPAEMWGGRRLEAFRWVWQWNRDRSSGLCVNSMSSLAAVGWKQLWDLLSLWVLYILQCVTSARLLLACR